MSLLLVHHAPAVTLGFAQGRRLVLCSRRFFCAVHHSWLDVIHRRFSNGLGFWLDVLIFVSRHIRSTVRSVLMRQNMPKEYAYPIFFGAGVEVRYYGTWDETAITSWTKHQWK